ncbi:MAG: biopolymer transporter ExbD [Terriglobia bacterium]|nr:MAG: biopolymer transporter ExbD [Terriglobia bacterium]
MAMTTGSKGGPKSDINMTPMIDVLLVLIIIFMVITPLTPHGLEALVPQPPPPNSKPNLSDLRTVVIVIEKDGSIKINQDPVTEDKLGERLAEIFKTRAERVVFVKGDPDLEFAPVARAIDIAHGAGIDKVGLMTPKSEAGN